MNNVLKILLKIVIAVAGGILGIQIALVLLGILLIGIFKCPIGLRGDAYINPICGGTYDENFFYLAILFCFVFIFIVIYKLSGKVIK